MASKVRSPRTASRHLSSMRDRSSGWTAPIQPSAAYSSWVCPVIARHSRAVVDHLALGCGHPHHLGAGLNQRAVPLLLAADERLGPDPVGDVHRDLDHARDLPVGRMGREPRVRPMPALDGQIDVDHRAVLDEDLPERRLDLLGDLCRKDFGGTVAEQVGRRRSVDLGHRVVGPAEPQVGVEERESDRSLLEQGGEQRGIGCIETGYPWMRHGSVGAHPCHLHRTPSPTARHVCITLGEWEQASAPFSITTPLGVRFSSSRWFGAEGSPAGHRNRRSCDDGCHCGHPGPARAGPGNVQVRDHRPSGPARGYRVENPGVSGRPNPTAHNPPSAVATAPPPRTGCDTVFEWET